MRSFEGHFEVMWARFSLFQNETEQNKSARYTFHHHKDLDNLCFGNLDLRFKVHQEDTHPLSNLKMGQIILYRVLRTFFCPSTISVYKNCLRPCTIESFSRGSPRETSTIEDVRSFLKCVNVSSRYSVVVAQNRLLCRFLIKFSFSRQIVIFFQYATRMQKWAEHILSRLLLNFDDLST